VQDSPNKETLLLAIARFLGQEVRPLVADPRVNFRLLVASSLAAIAAMEIDAEDAQDEAELARLRALFPVGGHPRHPGPVGAGGEEPRTRTERHRAIREGSAHIAEEVRSGRATGERLAAIRAHVKETLAEKLRVNNPRFSLEKEID
jgi:hypothetical protein